MIKTAIAASLGFSALMLLPAAPAHAQSTVECHSINYNYTECQAPLRAPQLIHQISSSACIVNRSWGFNPATRRIWVAQGCAGVFADVGGYHYGRGDRYDAGARYYDDRGHDTGAVAAGVVMGAVLGAAVNSSYKDRSHTTTNNYYSRSTSSDGSGYDGCHGVGCLVDKPEEKRDTSQDVDPTVEKFDKDGNPNYDADGNYQGAHGVGKLVDNPDAETGDNPKPEADSDDSSDSKDDDNN